MKELKEWSRRCIIYQDPTAELEPREISNRLIFNENLVLPRDYYEEILKHIKENIDLAIRFYPSAKLREKISEKIAELYSLNKDNLFLTAGADEAMKLVFDALSTKTGKVLILRPTYGMPIIYAHNMNMKIMYKVVTRDYKIPTEEIVKCVVEDDVGLVYICNPNNPLSIEFTINEIEYIVKSVEALVLIDETYFEFADQDHSKLIDKYENVIIIRSLSKSWGLAGLRVGYILCREELCRLFRGLAQPFNISSIALLALEKAVELYDIVKDYIDYVKKIRYYIIDKLRGIPQIVEVFNSKTNFVTFRLEKYYDSNIVKEELKRRGFYVRTSSEPLLENCLRVTIAREETMNAFINTLTDILNEHKHRY